MYDVTHHFPHAHCSQIILEDFFSLDYLPFPLEPWICVPQERALEMWRDTTDQ